MPADANKPFCAVLFFNRKYDSIHGKFKHTVTTEKTDASKPEADIIVVNGHKIHCVMVWLHCF